MKSIKEQIEERTEPSREDIVNIFRALRIWKKDRYPTLKEFKKLTERIQNENKSN